MKRPEKCNHAWHISLIHEDAFCLQCINCNLQVWVHQGHITVRDCLEGDKLIGIVDFYDGGVIDEVKKEEHIEAKQANRS